MLVRLILILKSRHTGEVTRVPFLTFDRVHTDGSVTLSSVKLGNNPHRVPADRVIGWETREA